MGRPKGSKNKPKIECSPPEDRAPIEEEFEWEVIYPRITVIRKPGDRLDGIYISGRRTNGKIYVAKLGWADHPPITSELKKLLSIGEE